MNFSNNFKLKNGSGDLTKGVAQPTPPILIASSGINPTTVYVIKTADYTDFICYIQVEFICVSFTVSGEMLKVT
ncbi:hypothetical protein Mh1949_17680 [Mannheimia haemolytica]